MGCAPEQFREESLAQHFRRPVAAAIQPGIIGVRIAVPQRVACGSCEELNGAETPGGVHESIRGVLPSRRLVFGIVFLNQSRASLLEGLQAALRPPVALGDSID